MKKVVLLFVLFIYTFSLAQDNYKYVVVPKKFSFFKEENKFGLSELTKSFFEKEGFKVFYDSDVLPSDLYQNRCLALYASPIKDKNLFVTKIYFEIKDCNDNLLLQSETATSREKLLKTAFTQTFRQALSSLNGKINFKKADEIEKTEVVETPKEVVVISKNENISNSQATNTLFSIPTTNGYKLANDKPETIFILKKTSSENIFIALKDSKSGILIKKTSGWFFEYYEGEKLFSEKVEVKF